MSAVLSSAKASALLSSVQGNPEIGTADSAYVTALVTRVAEWLVSAARLPRYPELSQGYSKSNTSASEDLTSLSTNELQVSVNGSPGFNVNPALVNCDSGANIAAELQTVIRAASTDYGFDEVTVAFSGGVYTITSGRYGEGSSVRIGFTEAKKHVAQSLKLTKHYGGTEYTGSDDRAEADEVIVAVVEATYRKLGLEGVQSGQVPGDLSFVFYDLDPGIRAMFYNLRRLW